MIILDRDRRARKHVPYSKYEITQSRRLRSATAAQRRQCRNRPFVLWTRKQPHAGFVQRLGVALRDVREAPTVS